MQNLIDSTGKRLEDIIGDYTPTSSYIEGEDHTVPDVVYAGLSISRTGDDEAPVFALNVGSNFKVWLRDGPVGEFIGYKIAMSETLARTLASKQDGSIIVNRMNNLVWGQVNYYDPTIISSEAPVQLTNTLDKFLRTVRMLNQSRIT